MPEDDQSIQDATRLYRRLHPTQVIWDRNEGRIRPSSGAFKDESLSVNLGDELERLNELPDYALKAHPQHSLCSITAGFARGEDQVLARTPTDDDPSHGEVIGAKRGSRSTRFAKAAAIDILRREFLPPDVRASMDTAA